MSKQRLTIIIALVAVLMTAGFGTHAIAGKGFSRGMGYNQNMGPDAYGQGPTAYGPRGFNYRSNLTDEQIKQIEEKRSAFFEATTDLRLQMRSKRLALGSELVKSGPDAAKAAQLQQELSQLRAEFAQKRIAHLLEMKKIDPNIGMGLGRKGGGRGFGRSGGRAGGYCWR